MYCQINKQESHCKIQRNNEARWRDSCYRERAISIKYILQSKSTNPDASYPERRLSGSAWPFW